MCGKKQGTDSRAFTVIFANPVSKMPNIVMPKVHDPYSFATKF